MANFSELVGERIRKKMRRVNITAEALATELNVSPPTLSRLIKGSVPTVNWDLLEGVAKKLGWSVSELVDMDTRSPDLTGIRKIDDAIDVFHTNLFQGAKGYLRVRHLEHEDYHINYATPDYQDADSRRGPTSMEEEFNMNGHTFDRKGGNKRIGEIHVQVKQADVSGEYRILLHTIIKRIFFVAPEDYNNKGGHIPVTHTQMIRRENQIIDQWILSKNIDQIRKGAPVKIRKRWISTLGIKDENLGSSIEQFQTPEEDYLLSPVFETVSGRDIKP
jgi:transcriptional regulator with XRE-family HTH domain